MPCNLSMCSWFNTPESNDFIYSQILQSPANGLIIWLGLGPRGLGLEKPVLQVQIKTEIIDQIPNDSHGSSTTREDKRKDKVDQKRSVWIKTQQYWSEVAAALSSSKRLQCSFNFSPWAVSDRTSTPWNVTSTPYMMEAFLDWEQPEQLSGWMGVALWPLDVIDSLCLFGSKKPIAWEAPSFNSKVPTL